MLKQAVKLNLMHECVKITKRLRHLLQVWPARLRLPLLLRMVCVDCVELNCVTHAYTV